MVAEAQVSTYQIKGDETHETESDSSTQPIQYVSIYRTDCFCM